MSVVARLILLLVWSLVPLGFVAAQEKSVKPGVNDAFRDPDPKEFQGKFEIESREVFSRRKDIFAACRIKPGMTVADIGAGTGLFTRLFSDAVGQNGRVIAVDISQKFLAHIEKASHELGQRNVETLLCKPDSTELPANTIDVAFICDTYHHFEFPLRTMTSVHRALKPGGRVIVVDFRRVPGVSTEWVMNHVRAGQEVFESEIVQAGFRKTAQPENVLKENYLVEFTKGGTPGLKPLVFPIIEGFGGVAPLREATEQPRAGGRVILDVTADAPVDGINKGLERAARLLNLYGAAGLQATDVKIAVVLHGEATKSILNDDFYKPRFGVEANPNLPLIRELKKAGVAVFVCGQALNYKGFPESAVSQDAAVAVAALTVVMNKQADGHAYVPVP